jgi:hypothetical protein
VWLSFAAGLLGAIAFAGGRFAGGGVLLVASVVALRWPASLWLAADPPELPRRTRLLALLAVGATAAFFRFYRMAPPGLWGDDAINGLLAFEILDGGISSPYQLVAHSASRFHALANYPIAAAFWVFGPGLATLRLPGVLLSLLSVPLLYATLVPLFGARAALIAGFFFATSPMQLSHGKILIQGITGAFLHLLGMCLVVRACTGSRRWLLAAAGLPLGLSLCTYHATKVGALIAVAYLLYTLVHRREDRLGLALWGAAGLLVMTATAAPGWLPYADDPGALTGRISGTSILTTIRDRDSLWPLWDSFGRSLTIFHYQQGPVQYHWFGIGTDPAVNAVVAFLAVHGFVESLRRWREPRHFLLLAWFAVGMAPGILSSEAPRVYRVLLAAPPVFLWAALPVGHLLASAARVPPGGRSPQPDQVSRPGRRAARALATLVLLAVPVIDFNDYFYRVYTHRDYHWMHASRMVHMAQTLRDLGPDWTGYLLAASFDSEHETFRFLKRIWGLRMRDVASLSDILPQRRDENALLIFDPTTIPLTAAVKAFYPATEVRTHQGPRWRTWFLDDWLDTGGGSGRDVAAYVQLSKAATRSLHGLTAVYLDAAGVAVGSRVRKRLAVDGDEILPPDLARASRLALSGAVYAPADGSYALELDGAAAATVTIDGRPVLEPGRRTASVDLVQGLHAVNAVVDLGRGSFAVRWRPPGSAMQPISPELLYHPAEIRGWLAEYTGEESKLRRLEPAPWYVFFPPTFDGRYQVHWRGRLRVPASGRYLSVRARSRVTMTIDGEPSAREAALSGGLHDIDLRLDNLEGAQFLELMWRSEGGAAERVPLDAFLPPLLGNASP